MLIYMYVYRHVYRYAPIRDDPTCAAAAAFLVKQYSNTLTNAGRPAGCYLSTTPPSPGDVGFNLHVTGAAEPNSQPLCISCEYP